MGRRARGQILRSAVGIYRPHHVVDALNSIIV
jgi:hypothetical protein